MIILDEIKQEENYSHSMFVTYPRTIQISHGVYDNVVDMHNMCMIYMYIDIYIHVYMIFSCFTPVLHICIYTAVIPLY